MADTFELTITEDIFDITLNDGVPMAWGYITGDIATQTDLIATFAPKYPIIRNVTLNADSIIPSAADIVRLKGYGNIILASRPSLQAGQYDGQPIRLFGDDDSAIVTLQDNTVLAGSTLHLPYGRNIRLGKHDNILFLWNLSQTAWVACSPVIDTH